MKWGFHLSSLPSISKKLMGNYCPSTKGKVLLLPLFHREFFVYLKNFHEYCKSVVYLIENIIFG